MSDYLPKDAVTEILLRLPAKSLIKCRAVCKSWRSLLHSSAFINAHLALRRRNDQTNLLFLDTNSDRCLRHCLETGESTYLPRPPSRSTPQGRFVRNFCIDGSSCNGLVFGFFMGTSDSPVIWNPSIRRFVSLPSPNIELSNDVADHYLDHYAFGYDMTTDDYKVLRIIRPTDHYFSSWRIEVYSLATAGSWKILSSDVSPNGYMAELLHDNGVLLSNALHWFQVCTDRKNCILVFDMHDEIFREMHVPEAIANRMQDHFNDAVMSQYAESLAIVIFSSITEDRVEMGHVWVMTQYGVKDSWKLLYSVRLDILTQSNPLGLTRNGDIIFEEGIFGPLFYVKSSGEAVRLVTDVTVGPFVGLFMNSFIESLVLLGQANAISC